jgi:hypothetical protein
MKVLQAARLMAIDLAQHSAGNVSILSIDPKT